MASFTQAWFSEPVNDIHASTLSDLLSNTDREHVESFILSNIATHFDSLTVIQQLVIILELIYIKDEKRERISASMRQILRKAIAEYSVFSLTLRDACQSESLSMTRGSFSIEGVQVKTEVIFNDKFALNGLIAVWRLQMAKMRGSQEFLDALENNELYNLIDPR